MASERGSVLPLGMQFESRPVDIVDQTAIDAA